MAQLTKKDKRQRRARRSRAKIRELNAVRLTVHRTPRHIYAQIISADGGTVIAAASTVQDAVADGPVGRPVQHEVQQVAIVRHDAALHVHMRPVRSPDQALRRVRDQRAGHRRDGGIGEVLFRATHRA